MIRKLRRAIKRRILRGEQRAAYTRYVNTTEKPLPYRRWLEAVAKNSL